jgi:hypothetical protein
MTSLSDILTAIKNLVTSVTGLRPPVQTTNAVSSGTVIVTGAGRLINYAVTVAGSAAGTINNAATTSAVAASNVMVTAPATLGVYPCGQAFSYGLVIVPGSGQSINVTYSLS